MHYCIYESCIASARYTVSPQLGRSSIPVKATSRHGLLLTAIQAYTSRFTYPRTRFGAYLRPRWLLLRSESKSKSDQRSQTNMSQKEDPSRSGQAGTSCPCQSYTAYSLARLTSCPVMSCGNRQSYKPREWFQISRSSSLAMSRILSDTRCNLGPVAGLSLCSLLSQMKRGKTSLYRYVGVSRRR